MNRRVLVIVAALVAVSVGILALALTLGGRRLPAPRQTAAAPIRTASAPGTPHITATLFYGSDDGQSLVAVRAEVPLADSVVAQGTEILKAQLGAPPAPYVSVIPRGTGLRAFYITERGDAFVDLSPEISTAHPGGSLTELLTVYSLVNAVAANLPAVQRVQLLVGGKEVDTIAGHVDVRRPLTRDVSLVRGEQPH